MKAAKSSRAENMEAKISVRTASMPGSFANGDLDAIVGLFRQLLGHLIFFDKPVAKGNGLDIFPLRSTR